MYIRGNLQSIPVQVMQLLALKWGAFAISKTAIVIPMVSLPRGEGYTPVPINGRSPHQLKYLQYNNALCGNWFHMYAATRLVFQLNLTKL